MITTTVVAAVVLAVDVLVVALVVILVVVTVILVYTAVAEPGQCQAFRCPISDEFCKDECLSDFDCPGLKKCCQMCTKCKQCLEPIRLPAVCDDVVCGSLLIQNTYVYVC